MAFNTARTHQTNCREQFKQRLVVLFAFLAVNTVFSVLPIALHMKNLTVIARGVGIALSYAWALLIGYDFGRRISQYDREFAKPADTEQE